MSRKAIGILKEQYNLSSGKGYVFPSERTGGQMGGSTLITTMYSLRKLPDGIRPEEMTVHGFRAIASTLLNASGLWRPDAIERQLSHAPEDKIREAYNRGDYMEERIRMMQWYADKIDDLYANDMI